MLLSCGDSCLKIIGETDKYVILNKEIIGEIIIQKNSLRYALMFGKTDMLNNKELFIIPKDITGEEIELKVTRI
jgi:hypothetical protein